MRKTTIIASAVAMSVSAAGLAYAVAPDGRAAEDSSVVTTFSPSSDASSASSSSSSTPEVTPSASPTDDRGRGGHGADDGIGTTPMPTPSMPTGTHQRHDGSDDGPGHDVGDDHGGDRHGGDDDSSGRGSGGDDGSGHDAGDDHGGGGHGSDD